MEILANIFRPLTEIWRAREMANDGLPEQTANDPDKQSILTYKEIERLLNKCIMDYKASSINSRKAAIERYLQIANEQVVRDLEAKGRVRRKCP
jgi:hypothetical protein